MSTTDVSEIDIHSIYYPDTRMCSKGEGVLTCPKSGLVYPVLHEVPVTLMDPDMRAHCFYVDKMMAADGVFNRSVPLPTFYPEIRKPISWLRGLVRLLRFQLGYVVPQAPGLILKVAQNAQMHTGRYPGWTFEMWRRESRATLCI